MMSTRDIKRLVPRHLWGTRQMGLDDLYFFCKGILGYDKLQPEVHLPVCRQLESAKARRVMVTMPRGWFKSTVASVGRPLQAAVKDPNRTHLLAMNTEENAKPKHNELKSHVEMNDLFRACYPEVIPDFNSVDWSTKKATLRRDSNRGGQPTFEITGAKSRVVSRHVDDITMDDLVTATQDDTSGGFIVPNREDIERAIMWYRMSMSLLNHPTKGHMYHIGTRWAPADMVSYLEKKSAAFRRNHYTIKAKKEDGTPTCPAILDAKALKELEAEQGSTIFQLWYMNEPVDPSELVFMLDPDLNFYDSALLTAEDRAEMRVYTAVDLAFSDKEKADNCAFVTVGVDADNVRYVLNIEYGKYTPMEMVEMLFHLHECYKPRVIGIEAVAAQALLPRMMPYFMKKFGRALPIREIMRGGHVSKTTRHMALQPWVEQRLLKLPRGMAKPLEVEMRDYRLDTKRRGHDDALDALADAVQLSTQPNIAHRPSNKRIRTVEEWEQIRVDAYDTDLAVEELVGAGNKPQMPFDRQLAETRFSFLN